MDPVQARQETLAATDNRDEILLVNAGLLSLANWVRAPATLPNTKPVPIGIRFNRGLSRYQRSKNVILLIKTFRVLKVASTDI